MLIFLFNNSFLQSQNYSYDLRGLVEKSENIVKGRVSEIKYYEKKPGVIYSKISFKIYENINGNLQSAEIIYFDLLGGMLNEIRTIVLGSPQFKVGEYSILFLTTSKKSNNLYNKYILTGVAQGKFNLFSANSTTMVRRDIFVSEELEISTNSKSYYLSNNNNIPLEDFLDKITELLE